MKCVYTVTWETCIPRSSEVAVYQLLRVMPCCFNQSCCYFHLTSHFRQLTICMKSSIIFPRCLPFLPIIFHSNMFLIKLLYHITRPKSFVYLISIRHLCICISWLFLSVKSVLVIFSTAKVPLLLISFCHSFTMSI